MEKSSVAVSIVIPAYNEEASIAEQIKNVKQVMDASEFNYEIIVVDDSSTDKTSIMAEKTGARVFHHLNNRGYGASLKTGIYESKNEIIVITDADGTYPSNKIPEMIRLLENSDMVVGERSGKHAKIPFIRKPAKWFLGKFAQFVTEKKIKDLNSGLRAFRKSFVNQYSTLLSDRFSFTTTLTVASLCDDFKITYIPIDYFKRKGKSKIVPWDFVNFMVLVLRLSVFFNPLKVFIPIFNLFFIIGILKLAFDIVIAINKVQETGIPLYEVPIVSASALILILSSFIMLFIGMISESLSKKIAQGRMSPYKTHWKGYIGSEYIDDEATKN
jgi:glycosyltransferase involved in cell wall biosynthesis